MLKAPTRLSAKGCQTGQPNQNYTHSLKGLVTSDKLKREDDGWELLTRWKAQSTVVTEQGATRIRLLLLWLKNRLWGGAGEREGGAPGTGCPSADEIRLLSCLPVVGSSDEAPNLKSHCTEQRELASIRLGKDSSIFSPRLQHPPA